MATASHAIEQVATVAGIPPATVSRAARALREADVTLWPQGTQGRGKGAHVEPRHLVNLVLALGNADPITNAASVVTVLRGLVPYQPNEATWMSKPPAPKGVPPGDTAELVLEWTRYLVAIGKLHLDKAEAAYRILPGSTLGDALDNLVDFLAWPEGSRFRARIAVSDMALDLMAGDLASVGYASYFADGTEHYVQGHYRLSQSDLGLMDRTVQGITRRTRIHGFLFECLADLWSDTQRHRASSAKPSGGTLGLSLSSTAHNAPENETAADHPLPGTGAAALSDQPAQTELDGGPRPHLTDEREESQSSSGARAGHSHQRVWSDPHDRYRKGGADRAAA